LPLLENDVIFAYLNEYDPKHEYAENIFENLRKGEIHLHISSVSLIEMELIYRSEKREDKLLEDLAALAALPSVSYEPLTPDVTLTAVYLRQTLKITFFDSHYAAAALNTDRTIISFDPAYDNVQGLTRIDPSSLIQNVKKT